MLGELAGIGGFAEALARSSTMRLWGLQVPILDLEALIASKRALGRPKDLEALRELELIRDRSG